MRKIYQSAVALSMCGNSIKAGRTVTDSTQDPPNPGVGHCRRRRHRRRQLSNCRRTPM